MGKFSNIAILSDLDRTFFADGTKMVQRNVEAIEYFKSEGGLFSLATGRMHYNLDVIIPGVIELVNSPALMCNGTYFYDFKAQKIFNETFMDGEKIADAVKSVHNKYESAVIRGCDRDGYVIDTVDRRAEKGLITFGIDAYKFVPIDEWGNLDLYKMVFNDKSEVLDAVQEDIENDFSEVFEFNRSSATLLELQMRGVNKSILIDPFKQYYKKQGRQLTVYACGDNENDLAMIKKADVGVCPSNAIDRVKEVSDHCLCSNNEGVIADIIYKLL